MVIELLLLLGLSWWATIPTDQETGYVLGDVDSALRSVLTVARNDRYLSSLGILADNDYRLRVNDTKPYAEEKYTIYLPIWNKLLQRPYDLTTLIVAGIHELGHVLCPDSDPDHSDTYNKIENRLLVLAQTIGVLEKDYRVDPSYVKACCSG